MRTWKHQEPVFFASAILAVALISSYYGSELENQTVHTTSFSGQVAPGLDFSSLESQMVSPTSSAVGFVMEGRFLGHLSSELEFRNGRYHTPFSSGRNQAQSCSGSYRFEAIGLILTDSKTGSQRIYGRTPIGYTAMSHHSSRARESFPVHLLLPVRRRYYPKGPLRMGLMYSCIDKEALDALERAHDLQGPPRKPSKSQ